MVTRIDPHRPVLGRLTGRGAVVALLALFAVVATAQPVVVPVDAGGRVPTDPSATLGPATFTFTVAAPFTVTAAVMVNLDIVHSWTEDLDITLTAPGGAPSVLLVNHRGSVPAFANFDDTFLDDLAPTHISGGAPPFAGAFRPEVPLGAFAGIDPNGVWTLTINDIYYGDYGWLYRAGDATFETRRGVMSGTFLVIVPEPTSAVLLFLALMARGLARRR